MNNTNAKSSRPNLTGNPGIDGAFWNLAGLLREIAIYSQHDSNQADTKDHDSVNAGCIGLGGNFK
ncbi:MAG: hypothetical protein GY845_29230 [Planctomycetes bacterium]|nr:hypothetical protein [Planctomycetota bacterium]